MKHKLSDCHSEPSERAGGVTDRVKGFLNSAMMVFIVVKLEMFLDADSGRFGRS